MLEKGVFGNQFLNDWELHGIAGFAVSIDLVGWWRCEGALKALYNVNFLLHDLHCIGWGDLATRLRGIGVHADSSHLR